jgi:PPOX class probable F420-dependent enzyme
MTTLGDRLTAASNRLYLRMRDPQAWRVQTARGGTGFEAMQGQKYCLLHTFKRSGEAVPTPVWFGLADGKLYFYTGADAPKIKRIRANPRVRVAPCNPRGKPMGPAAEARARVLDPHAEPRAEAAIQANYGLYRRVYEGAVQKLKVPGVYVEVSPAPVGTAAPERGERDVAEAAGTPGASGTG